MKKIERAFISMSMSAAALLLLVGGCAQVSRSPILVPPESVREWTYLPDGQTGPGRYVIRMTDGRREWEVEFPEAMYGSEVRVPLRNGVQLRGSGDRPGLTAADREMEEARVASERAMRAEDPVNAGDDKVPAKRAAAPAPAGAPGETRAGRAKTSYLVGVAQVRDLYNSRNYEIALVQLVDLEREYSDDEKLLAMKGSIYRRLGKNKPAREAWERVLALNPDNVVVAAALRELAEEEEKNNRDRSAPPLDDATDDAVGPAAPRPRK